MKMEENHVAGSAKTMGGKMKEDFSRIARDAQAQIKGQGEQVEAADDLDGQARNAASGFTDVVRRTIEEQPYTAVAVALAVGWLLGRTHRPL
jgi:ElaB/YqjD/DUF883 family membrane-anchored ribosome-binding protein